MSRHSIFVSHGAPDLVLHDTPARNFLAGYGQQLAKPKAIVLVSAHFLTSRPSVSVSARPEMIYDFGGFDPRLRTLSYDAVGAPEIARRIVASLQKQGVAADPVERGFDHGTWVPLMLLYPDADIPVVTLSVQPELGPRHHYDLGRALSWLADEDVLVIGSGALTHNLAAVFSQSARPTRDAEKVEWAGAFADWVEDRIAAGDLEALLDYRNKAPFAVENHPTDEHLLPLFVALGAAQNDTFGVRVHSSHEFGALMMDAYAFGIENAA